MENNNGVILEKTTKKIVEDAVRKIVDEYERKRIIWGKPAYYSEQDDYYVIMYFYFDKHDKIGVIIDDEKIFSSEIYYPELWAIRFNVYVSSVERALSKIKIGDSFSDFYSVVKAEQLLIEKEQEKLRQEKEEIARKMRIEAEKEEAKRLEAARIEAEKEEAKRLETARIEAEKKKREQIECSGIKSEEKKISIIEQLVGVCRFEYQTIKSRNGKSQILDVVRVNFLINDKFTFEDVKKLQNDILFEVSKKLSNSSKFKKYDIPIGCFKAKMFFKNTPKSITIIFTLKDELIKEEGG